jgi:hypothetical protein
MAPRFLQILEAPSAGGSASPKTMAKIGGEAAILFPIALRTGAERQDSRQRAALALASGSALLSYQRPLRSGIEPEDAQLLIAAAGLRDACSPRDRLIARGQLEHGEAAVERRRPRVAAFGDRAIRRDECGRHRFIDSAADDINAGGFRLIDHRVSVTAYRLPLAVWHNHRRAGKGN